MRRVSLRRLVINNFRSFKGQHVLEFPKSGLVIIKGASGHGKTNILLALAYAFGICPLSAKSLQCWYTEDPMSVEVYLDTDGGEAVLKRGDKLSLKIGDKLIKGSAKAVEEALDTLCGVKADLRDILTYRSQRKPKKFLSMTDTKMKEFLFQVLQLTDLEEKLDEAAAKLGPLEKQTDLDAAALNTWEEELKRINESAQAPVYDDVQELEDKLTEAQVREADEIKILGTQKILLVQTVKEQEQKLQQLCVGEEEEQKTATAEANAILAEPIEISNPELTRLKGVFAECQGHIESTSSAVGQAHIQFDAETAVFQKEARKLHNELARCVGIMGEIRRLTDEAAKLKEDNCPTCDRTWENAAAQYQARLVEIKKQELELEAVRAHKSRADELDAILKGRVFVPDPRLTQLKTVLATIREQMVVEEQKNKTAAAMQRADIEKRAAQAQTRAAAARSAVLSKRQQYASDQANPVIVLGRQVRDLEASFSTTREVRAQAQSALELVRQKNKLTLQYHEESLERLHTAESKVRIAKKTAAASRAEWKRESDYVDLLKGFRNKVFDEVLESVGTQATSILAGLNNASHITVEFNSDKVSANGNVQEKITPVVYIHGEERKLDEAVSGGQFTSVELAVDLAMARVITDRLNCHLNWIVLDESFEGHDPDTKQSCSKILSEYAVDKLVIIVDHSSEFKEMFTQTVEVRLDHKLSSITQVA